MNKVILNDDLLKVSDGRFVRNKFSMNGEGEIIIYEPSTEDMKEIKQLMGEVGSHEFTIDEIFNVLIYKFTNLDMSEVSEDIKYKLIKEQPLWLTRVCAEIQLIISEIVGIQALEIKETINKVNNMSAFVEFMGVYDKETIAKIESIDVEEMKKALEGLSEEEKNKLKQLLVEMNKG